MSVQQQQEESSGKRAFAALKSITLSRPSKDTQRQQSNPKLSASQSNIKADESPSNDTNIDPQYTANGQSSNEGVRSWYNKYRKPGAYQDQNQNAKSATTNNNSAFDVKKWPMIEYNQVIEDVVDETQSSQQQQKGNSLVEKLWVRKKKANNAQKRTLVLDQEKLNLSKSEKRRQEVIYEIVLTERDYVQDIKVLAELFIKKIREKKLLSQYNLRKIFSNIEELVGVNETFYKALFDKRATAYEQAQQVLEDKKLPEEERIKQAYAVITGYTIGDIFNLLTPYFRSYSLYCSGHSEGAETLNQILKVAKNASKDGHKTLRKKNVNMNPRNATKLKNNMMDEDLDYDVEKQRERARELALYFQYCSFKPECRNLDIFSFLIKPIQRLCKYPLLLKELLKCTDQTHPDYQLLSKSMEMVEKVVMEVNERKRFHEGAQTRIVDLRKRFIFDAAVLTGVEEGRDKRFDIMGVASRKIIKEQGENGDLLEIKDLVQNKALSTNQRWVVLFNDILLIAKLNEKSMFSNNNAEAPKIKVKNVISLKNILSVDDIKEIEGNLALGAEKKQHYGLKIQVKDLVSLNEGYATIGRNPNKNKPKNGYLYFACQTKFERDSWVGDLNKLLDEIKQDQEQREKIMKERPTAIDKLFQQDKPKVVENEQKEKLKFDIELPDKNLSKQFQEEKKSKVVNVAQSLNPNLFLSQKAEQDDSKADDSHAMKHMSIENIQFNAKSPQNKILENIEKYGSRQSLDIFQDDDEEEAIRQDVISRKESKPRQADENASEKNHSSKPMINEIKPAEETNRKSISDQNDPQVKPQNNGEHDAFQSKAACSTTQQQPQLNQTEEHSSVPVKQDILNPDQQEVVTQIQSNLQNEKIETDQLHLDFKSSESGTQSESVDKQQDQTIEQTPQNVVKNEKYLISIDNIKSDSSLQEVNGDMMRPLSPSIRNQDVSKSAQNITQSDEKKTKRVSLLTEKFEALSQQSLERMDRKSSKNLTEVQIKSERPPLPSKPKLPPKKNQSSKPNLTSKSNGNIEK